MTEKEQETMTNNMNREALIEKIDFYKSLVAVVKADIETASLICSPAAKEIKEVHLMQLWLKYNNKLADLYEELLANN